MESQEPDNFPKKSFRISKRAFVWTIIIGAVVAMLLYFIAVIQQV
jgi:hypothetical protein